MRLFKPKFKNKKGQQKEVKKWWIELRDHNGINRRFAGLTDKAATEEIGRNIQRLISFRSAYLPPDAQLVCWLENISVKVRSKIVEFGLLDESGLAATKSLEEHLVDFEESLILHGKEKHIRGTLSVLRKIVEGCKFRFWSDVRVSDIEIYLAERRKQDLSKKGLPKKGLSKKTVGYYAKAFRQFSKWMLKEKRITEAPVIHYERAPKNYGRAFELDEFQKLLEVTLSGPERDGLTGYVRYVCYVIAVETGLRRGELRSLTPASFDFKGNTVFVSGEHTKNGEPAVQEFSLKTAGLLKEFIANKMPGVQLFPVPDRSSIMIKADCQAAGVKVIDHTGRSLNFHSLRHTCGSFLAASNAHPKVIQEVMRHKDINLTMLRYTHILRGQRRSAIESMSNFTKRRATGTE